MICPLPPDNCTYTKNSLHIERSYGAPFFYLFLKMSHSIIGSEPINSRYLKLVSCENKDLNLELDLNFSVGFYDMIE